VTRDLDLARRILLAVEAHPEPYDNIELSFDGVDPELVSYHVKLLTHAGLLEAENTSTMGRFEWTPSALTWEGHEFLDATRNDTVWRKTKEVAAEKGGGLPFDIVKALAVKLLSGMLDL
jgi:Hypothetical protein (DUF2513)